MELRRFTVDEYHQMAEAGILDPDERVELLDGAIVKMSPIGARHWKTHAALVPVLIGALAGRALVVGQGSFPLGLSNEPEPDIAIVDGRWLGDRSRELPPTADLWAMIELAETSLNKDLRVKVPLYGRFGIPDYVVVDLDAALLYHHTGPHDLGYRDVRTLRAGETFALARIPDVALDVAAFTG